MNNSFFKLQLIRFSILFALSLGHGYSYAANDPGFDGINECDRLLQVRAEVASTETRAFIDSQFASSILSTVPKVGDYSLITFKLGANLNTKIIVDSAAPWLMRTFEKFIGHSPATTDQNEIRKFLDHLSEVELADLVKRQPEMYRGDARKVYRDGETYTLSEWILSKKRKDISLALIGQVLFENFVKKESRIVEVIDSRNPKKMLGLMVMNRNAELLVPGNFVSGVSHASLSILPAQFTSNSVPATNDPKKPQFFTIVDFKGKSHEVRVVNRSAVEKIAKSERDQIASASPDDLVPVEFYLLPGFLPGGTTTLRIGDSITHYGAGGWDHPLGTEGVKRYLINDPWSRRMYLSHRGLELPPFNIGVKILLPKSKVDEIKAALEREYSVSENEGCGFKFTSNNCVHNPARVFKSVGVPIEQGKIYSDFSSTLFIRNLFLKPIYPVQSVNIYPFAGNEMNPAQLRGHFPTFMSGDYSIATDRKLSRISSEFRWHYHLAVFLEAVERAGPSGQPAVEESMRRMMIAETPEQFKFYLKGAVDEGLFDAERFELTEKGRSVHSMNQKLFNMDEAIIH